jgi:hypothetical protein
MATTETIVGDPSEFISGRSELAFDKLGLKIVGEPDWGDADIETFMVKQLLGEIPADRHPPNRTISITLQARETGGVSLAEVLQKLQQKVGLWQRESGWLRRDFDTRGKFKRSVGFIVHYAVLGGIEGWLMAHRNKVPEITLVFTCGPFCYGTAEEESAEFKATAHDLPWELASVKGTAPGLLRAVVKNENAALKNWRALIAAAESRDHPQDATKDTTALLGIEAENLTRNPSSELNETTGASGGKLVQMSTKTAYQYIVKSKIAAGDLTHIGNRRIIIRAFEEANPITCHWELRWRPMGSPYWETNDEVPVQLDTLNGFTFLDLGEVRLDRPVIGNKGWEFQVRVKQSGTVVGSRIARIDKLWVLPTEQYVAVSNPPATPAPDGVQGKTEAGTLVFEAGSGADWINPEKAKTSNNEYATATLTPTVYWSDPLRLTKWGFTIPEGMTIVGVVAEIERKASKANQIRDLLLHLRKADGTTSDDNSSHEYWPLADAVRVYGSSETIWGFDSLTRAEVNAEGFGIEISAQMNSGMEEAVASIDQIKLTVYYAETADESPVCFASRSIQLRSDGIYRQHPTAEVWGRVVPWTGFYPFAAPSGMESRAIRGVIIPSAGDLDLKSIEEQDASLHKLSAKIFYRPAYHFTSEAE